MGTFTAKLPRALPALALAAGLAVLPGCDLHPDEADLDNGRQLFVERCGTCHAFTEAGTQAQVAPDLDAAFKAARETGMDSDTVQGVVRSQIANPRVTDPDAPDYMPPDLVMGDDARDVAAYVAEYAGVPGVEPPIPPDAPPGAQVFLAQGCGSCHTLAELGDVAAGTVGPDLDEVIPGQDAEQVEEAIIDPEAQVTPGFPAGVMPDIYGDVLSDEELNDLVQFLLEATGGGNGGGSNGGS